MRDEAEALAIALERGVIEVADVIRWVDARISEQLRPVEPLLELAMASRRSPLDLVAMLQRLPGVPDDETAIGLFVRLLERAFEHHPSRIRHVVASLCASGNTRLGDELEAWAAMTDDRFYLAAHGIGAESYEEVFAAAHEEMRDLAQCVRYRDCVWIEPVMGD